MPKVLSITVLAFFSAVIYAQAADIMKAFPPAEEGMVRYVLQLPKLEDESTARVELIVGKTVQVDEANTYFFGGKIEKETIKGWGYSRYLVKKIGPMTGTLMEVDPSAPKVDLRKLLDQWLAALVEHIPNTMHIFILHARPGFHRQQRWNVFRIKPWLSACRLNPGQAQKFMAAWSFARLFDQEFKS